MGWLTMPLSSMHPYASPKAYLDGQFTYDRRDVTGRQLANVYAQVYYAAAVPSTDGVDGPAFAVVCLVKWNPRDKEGYVFGYKDSAPLRR